MLQGGVLPSTRRGRGGAGLTSLWVFSPRLRGVVTCPLRAAFRDLGCAKKKMTLRGIAMMQRQISSASLISCGTARLRRHRRRDAPA